MKSIRAFSIFFCFILFLIFANENVYAQQKYWVFFKYKSTQFQPYNYFSPKALERRRLQMIPICDSTDFPVNANFIFEVNQLVDTVLQSTRWFNGVAVGANQIQIEHIKKLNFVKSVQKIESKITVSENGYTDLATNEKDLLIKQVKVMQGDIFHKNGIKGTGVRIAIFDAGFPAVDYLEVFGHLHRNKRIISTWDFTKNKDFVYDYNEHGTMVLSCIAGIVDDTIPMGLATDAEFLLARTEVEREPFSEEENWLAAVEWADKNGADIINSSLGYTYHRYFNEDMDGKTSLVSKAANMAARKGILVLNAMGNDGDNDWKMLGTPADADSILSISGINPTNGYKIEFSSLGPTWDKRLKPNLCSYGEAVVCAEDGLTVAEGTSFSSPLVAGFAACVKQLNMQLGVMELFKKMEKSGSLFPYFDYAHGYGVPLASEFFDNEIKNESEFATFRFDVKSNLLHINVFKNYIVKKGLNDENYLYYKITNKDGWIEKYVLIEVYQENACVLNLDEYTDNQEIAVYYKGFYATYKL